MARTEQRFKRKHQRLSWFLRRQIVLEYLEGIKTLRELSQDYGVANQSISRWAKSYLADQDKRKSRILSIDMTPEEQRHYEVLRQENELLRQQLATEPAQLRKENEDLKKQLEFTRMKAVAMETIIDLAKEELGIDLRKNSGARQPVKSGKITRRQK